MIYLDASVVFSVYCPDRNSAFAVSLIAASTGPFLLTSLCEFETVNAFRLRVFRNEISKLQADQARRKLDANMDSGAYLVRPLPEGAFLRAKALSKTITPVIGVRAAGLLHLAAALELGADTLYTFDEKQRQAAQAAGVAVNPVPTP